MKITIRETKTRKKIPAQILKANKKDMPLKKDGWQFNWRELYRDKEAMFYKVVLSNDTKVLGIVMVSMLSNEILFMNDIETEPQSVGSEGRYQNIAGSLIAYACRLSFEKGKGNYIGFLVFDSKTKLFNLYKNRYGATPTMGQRMCIEPAQGKKLITEYLKEKS